MLRPSMGSCAEALWQVYVDTLDRRPDSEWIANPRWMQLRTPSSPHPNHNKVVHARLAAAKADRRIAEVLADHQARGAGLGWAVSPTSTPDDLSERLVAAGIPCHGVMVGMTRDVPARPSRQPAREVRIDDLTIGPAMPDDAAELARFSAEAWGRSEAFRVAMEDKARRTLADPASPTRFFVARRGPELVGTSTLRLLDGRVGYLQGAVVDPTCRGRGLYRALTEVRFAELRRRGFTQVVIWGNALSAPAAARLGFSEVARGAYHDTT